jgi:phosphomannomutase/phosphoglucomutase
MKQKMQETGAPLGGEYSAHIFIKDRWYGFDDGIYAGARILELFARQSLSSSELFADLLRGVSTPEYSIAIADENKFELMDNIISKADFPDAELITLDGLRVEFKRGWGLVRASNTSPALLLRFEAEDETALAEIKQQFKALIRRADKTIDLNAL